jgi:hypothetical protein
MVRFSLTAIDTADGRKSERSITTLFSDRQLEIESNASLQFRSRPLQHRLQHAPCISDIPHSVERPRRFSCLSLGI